MGRRALPKIKEDIDLSGWLYQPEELASPFDALALFGRPASLEIEIGSGKGLFLRNAAAAEPDHNFLGIEVVGKYARFVAAKLAQAQHDHAKVIHGDGVAFLQSVPDRSVSAIHVYFPDPWWKKRHRKRRVINPTLLQATDRVLNTDGRFHLWTDVREYYESALELFAQHSRLSGPMSVDPRPALHDMDYRTHFERRVRQSGLPVYRAEFRQTD